MPKIDDLSLKETSKKFKRSNYRPWNYMDELEKEANFTLNTEVVVDVCDDKKTKIVNNTTKKNQVVINDVQEEQHNIINSNSERIQISNVDGETILDKIFCLTGHQKHIFLFIVERCVSRGLLNTGIVKIETLCEITKTSFQMVKLSIKRLIFKSLVNRNKGKKGRGGFHSFNISESTRNCFLEYKRLVGSKEDSNKTNHANITHINLNKKSYHSDEMPEEWKNINTELLKEIGFSENHLKQLYQKNLNTPAVTEESIKHFSFGLLNNPKIKQYQDPLNVLMGVLRKGQAWIENNYKSHQEIAQITLLENKKAEIERLLLLEKEAYDIAFTHWQSTLSSEDLELIIPSWNDLADKSEALIPKKVKLRIFFEKNIWPTKKKEYLIETEN